MALSVEDFIALWSIKGGGTPVADQTDGARDLALTGSGTAPRQASYKRRRGAEFRSATFSATPPRSFATPGSDGLKDEVYAASKVKSFTIEGWCKPQKSGVTTVALTPLGGLFSANNVGATPWIYDQPCFVFTDGTAGAGYVVVSVLGSILDTRTATQTVGPASTSPLADGENAFVAVRVTGSTTVSNQVDAVGLYVRTQDGVVRVYTLGENKAGARIDFGATLPADGKTVTIQGRVRTYKTTLTGTPASGQITYGGAGVPADGETVVAGGVTYTWRTYVGLGKRPTVVLEFNNPVTYNTSTPKTKFEFGGWEITCLWGTKYPTGGAGLLGFGSISSDISVAACAKVFDAMQGGYDGLRDLTQPATPSAGYDAGKGWTTDRRVTPGIESTTNVASSSYPRTIPLTIESVGAAAVAIMVREQTLATGLWDLPCTPARTGRNSPFIARVKAYSTDVIAAALGGAGSVADGTYKYTCTFVDSLGHESVEQTPTSRVVTGGPRAVSLTTIPLGPTGTVSRNVYRTKTGPTATYYLLTTIADNTTTTFSDTLADASLGATNLPTTIYMTGGAAAAGTASVLIDPGSWANCRDNLIAAINATGDGITTGPGFQYSADITTANTTASAASSGNNIALTSKFLGSAGNGQPLSEATACISGVTAFSGGGSGANDEVLIGATVQTAIDNLVAAINKTGSSGIQYGNDGTLAIDPTVTAESATSILYVRAKASGTSGNGKTISTDVTGAVAHDLFGDKVLTSLYGGQAAPPFVAGVGQRPDNADLQYVWGGWPS